MLKTTLIFYFWYFQCFTPSTGHTFYFWYMTPEASLIVPDTNNIIFVVPAPHAWLLMLYFNLCAQHDTRISSQHKSSTKTTGRTQDWSIRTNAVLIALLNYGTTHISLSQTPLLSYIKRRRLVHTIYPFWS